MLEIVYLIFNEGYAATAGDDWTRPALCEEAMRLGRVLAGLAPQEPEVHGLLALMELQASRLPARTDADGRPGAAARPGPAALGPVADPARAGRARPGGRTRWHLRPYALQAAIAACHARAPTAADTDWTRIAALYQVLVHVSPSPIVELNRAVAVGQAEGPRAAWRWSTRWSANGRWSATHTWPRCGAICWPGWAGGPRPGPSSSGRPP